MWTPRETTVAVRGGAASATLGARLYLIGGYRSNGDGTTTQVRTTSVYDPGTNTWTTRAPLPSVRPGASADRVFVAGRARIELVGGSRPGNNLQYVP
jgi:N-acetylneuraminic acid mutarotase